MKYISIFFIIFTLTFNITKSYAEDSLTVKQQLDRIMEEIKDLNKAVFNKSFDNEKLYQLKDNDDTERFTSIDIRIYDLQKDIKNLTMQFEETVFKLEDIASKITSLESEFSTKIEKIVLDIKAENSDKKQSKDINKIEQSTIKEENTLGKIVISNNKKPTNDLNSSDEKVQNEKITLESELDKLNPEEQIQFALDQMMKKNYDKSKKILENFTKIYPENQLSGSAHYWLGKIYLFETNYRKAAIVFGEGVQKFPNSIKAAEMYYELAKSLKEMNKFSESCKTLNLLEKNYKDNKFSKDPEKIKNKLDCEVNN